MAFPFQAPILMGTTNLLEAVEVCPEGSNRVDGFQTDVVLYISITGLEVFQQVN